MREPIPFSVHVVRRPDGGDLVIDRAHYEQVMKDVFGVLEEQPELLDDLCALYADPAPVRDPHDIARPDPADVLAERIVAALPPASTTIRLNRNPLARLGDAIDRVLGRRQWIPRQRGGRWAA
jgi:hypothetical protein